MNKLKYSLCIILLAILGGCIANDISQNAFEQNQGQVVVNDSVKEDDAWKKDIAARLLTEFYDFYNLRTSDGPRIYYSVLAADRATALLGVYRDYVPQNDLDFIESQKEELIIGGSSKIRFGYTESGLHILALRYDHTKGNENYSDLCDDLRKIDSENDFFQKMNLTGGGRTYMCDIYVDDLREKRETVNMNVEFFWMNGPEKVVSPKKSAFSSAEMEILNKYNRQVNNSKTEFKAGEWNLFALGYIIPVIEVTVDNEKIILDYKIR